MFKPGGGRPTLPGQPPSPSQPKKTIHVYVQVERKREFELHLELERELELQIELQLQVWHAGCSDQPSGNLCFPTALKGFGFRGTL